jgi:DNA polymerase III subunit epsilon
VVWFGNPGWDTDAAMAVRWLNEGGANWRYAALPYLPSPLTFVDVETTRDRVVEVAAVRFARGQMPMAWHSWVNPGPETRHRSGRYWNTAIHGLNAPLVYAAPPFGVVAPSLYQLCADATVVAHNVGFEHRHLVLEYNRLRTLWTRPGLCTLRLSRKLIPGRRDDGAGYTLDELAPALNIRNPAPHRAIGDVVTTVWVLFTMLERSRMRADLQEALREAHLS